MIVTKQQVREIMHGGDEIQYAYKPPANGTIQPLKTSPGGKPSCFVLVEDSWPLNEGGYSVLCKLHHQEAPKNYLRRGGGYTEDSSKAVKGPDGPDEGLYPQDLDDLVKANREKARHRRMKVRADQALLDREARVKAYMDEAAFRKIDIRNEVRLIRKLRQLGKSTDNPIIGIRRKLDRDMDKAA